MATYNGGRYLGQQLSSITSQIGIYDEVIVVDDGSTDQTLEILDRANLPNLRVFRPPTRLGPVHAFAMAMSQARGEFIFLSDQDDVWLPGRVHLMLEALEETDLVVMDAIVTDESLEPQSGSFFDMRDSGPGVWKNLKRSSYLGCCLAFRASVRDSALPIPPRAYMHDVWIGLVAECLHSSRFIRQPSLLYRRHAGTSTTISTIDKRVSIGIIRTRSYLAARLIGRVVRRHLTRTARD